jgi:hypothetical protein
VLLLLVPIIFCLPRTKFAVRVLRRSSALPSFWVFVLGIRSQVNLHCIQHSNPDSQLILQT